MVCDLEISRMDLVKMNVLLFPRLVQTYVGLGFMVMCSALGGIKLIGTHGVGVWLIMSLVLGFFVFIIVISLTIIFQAAFAKSINGTIGKTTYSLNDEFFIEETLGTETKTRWGSIERLYKFKNFMFIRINSMRIHIVPKREFVNDDLFDKFCEAVHSYKKMYGE